MKIQTNKKVTQSTIQKVLTNDSSKSTKMKELFNLGMEVKEISELMGVRYNFVYNVVSNYVNMNGIEVVKENKTSKKDLIINLHKEGKSNKEISIELKTNYNYVFNTIKEYKSKLGMEG